MTDEDLSSRKRISVNQIKPGMYVVGLDRHWLKTPFLLHRMLVKNDADINKFKRHGIREVVIDTSKGSDVGGLEPAAAPRQDESEASIRSGAERTNAEAGSLSTAEIAFQPVARELQTAQAIHEEALVAARGIFEGAAGGAQVKVEVARKVVADLMDSISRSPEANLLLTQMRRFQKDLFTHAINVCVLSLAVGTIEDFNVDVAALGLGALLHDVGETRMPRNSIRKTEALTTRERRLVQQHPRLGALLLEQHPDISPSARRIVLEHHERIDGSGYPVGARGDALSLMGQIVTITDAYDDMLSGRNQALLQPIEVLRQLFLQSSAGALDRELVERIIRCLGVYPIGSLVELNTGERGIVVAVNRADTLKPTVRIIMSSTGLTYSRGPIVSLADGAPERRIVASLDPGRERIDPLAFLRAAPPSQGDLHA